MTFAFLTCCFVGGFCPVLQTLNISIRPVY